MTTRLVQARTVSELGLSRNLRSEPGGLDIMPLVMSGEGHPQVLRCALVHVRPRFRSGRVASA